MSKTQRKTIAPGTAGQSTDQLIMPMHHHQKSGERKLGDP
jgi:hypothetical protein